MGTHSTCSLGRFSNGLLKDCAVMLCRRFARRSLQTKSIKCYKEHYSIINPDRKSNLQLFIIWAKRHNKQSNYKAENHFIPNFIIIIIIYYFNKFI